MNVRLMRRPTGSLIPRPKTADRLVRHLFFVIDGSNPESAFPESERARVPSFDLGAERRRPLEYYASWFCLLVQGRLAFAEVPITVRRELLPELAWYSV